MGPAGVFALTTAQNYMDAQARKGAGAVTTLDPGQLDFDNNYYMQKEFAKNGITWRIEDAARHGISPLAALGANSVSASPISVMRQGPRDDRPSWLQDLVSSMGQNISRAVTSMSTPEERAFQVQQIRGQALQNDLLDIQLQNAKLDLMIKGRGPGLPSTVQYMRTPQGTVTTVPSDDFSKATAGNLFSGADWYIRNKFVPALTFGAGQESLPGMTYMPIAGEYAPKLNMNWINPDVRGSRFHRKSHWEDR